MILLVPTIIPYNTKNINIIKSIVEKFIANDVKWNRIIIKIKSSKHNLNMYIEIIKGSPFKITLK